jgi:hypothetical protein
MAPDRPAEASPLDHGRESEGSGSDDTTTSMGLDVTLAGPRLSTGCPGQ